MWDTDVRTAVALGLPDDTLGPPAGPSGSEGKVGQESGERGPLSREAGSNPSQPTHQPGASLRSGLESSQ